MLDKQYLNYKLFILKITNSKYNLKNINKNKNFNKIQLDQ